MNFLDTTRLRKTLEGKISGNQGFCCFMEWFTLIYGYLYSYLKDSYSQLLTKHGFQFCSITVPTKYSFYPLHHSILLYWQYQIFEIKFAIFLYWWELGKWGNLYAKNSWVILSYEEAFKSCSMKKAYNVFKWIFSVWYYFIEIQVLLYLFKNSGGVMYRQQWFNF